MSARGCGRTRRPAPDRLFCHVYGRGKNAAQLIPGWPYSFVAALETGRTSWTAMLDAVRLGPADDATAVTAAQLRDVVDRLARPGTGGRATRTILIVFDAGYDVTRLAFLLRRPAGRVLGRLRSRPGPATCPPRPRHRGRSAARPGTAPVLASTSRPPHPNSAAATATETTRYGTAFADAWDRAHPRLHPPRPLARPRGRAPGHRRHPDPAARGPAARRPRPETGVAVVLARPAPTASDVDRLWQAFLRRFDLEHTFRLFKQTLGWTRPRLRDPRGRRPLDLADHRRAHPTPPGPRPGRRPAPPLGTPSRQTGRLTPARVRRGFRNLRPKLARPASAPKPTRPGPGRPPGSRNKQARPHTPVGKTQHQNATTNHNKPQKV